MKYGFLALTRSDDATTDTDTGKAVRKNLKTVWDTHCVDDDMVAYLGSSLVDSVKAVLAYVCEPAGLQPGSKRKAAAAVAEQHAPKRRLRGKE